MLQNRLYLLFELALVFFALPLLVSLYAGGKGLVFILWAAGAAAALTVRHMHTYQFKPDWNWAAVTPAALQTIFLRFILCAFALTAFTLWHDPEKFLSFPRQRPEFWALVMVLYPLLSVIPQEFIYRTFIFKRYAPLLPTQNLAIMLSAVAFSWMHIVLHNWIAITFTLIGGFMFATTYSKRRSLALACVEHALYGCFVFTIGLGWYFYHARFQ